LAALIPPPFYQPEDSGRKAAETARPRFAVVARVPPDG
jgi:hypothetical protein